MDAKIDKECAGGGKVKMDICMTCGKEVSYALWGGRCDPGHQTVHPESCVRCGRVCGVIIGDDYCGPTLMYCPDCIDKARTRK